MRRLVLLALVALGACNNIPPAAECAKYLACTEAITPGSSSSYVGSYGPKGTCWSTDGRAADACIATCLQGLQILAAGAGRDRPECQ